MSVFGPLIDGLPAIAFETRLPLTLVSMSKHWEEITGQPVQEALGLGWLERLDPNSVSVAFSEMEETLRGGGDIRYVVGCRAREDKWVWLRIVVRPVMEGGVPVGVWGLGLVVPGAEMLDDAARVRVEEMERAQASSDALLSTSPDLLFHVGSAGQFLGFRAGDQSQLFMRPADFLGKTFEEVMPPAVANDSRKALDWARQTGKAQTFAFSLPTLGSGELQHFEARLVPVKLGDFIVHVRDVTQVRRNEAELVAAREEALERSRLKTQFLANVSHEIRTPLNGILGVTQLLKQHSLPAEFQEYVDVLQNAGESLLAIVNDVLDLSKIEANRLELEPRVFDLEQVVVEAVRLFSTQAQKKKVELMSEVSLQARGPVRGDAMRVRQVLNNLVGNAIKFTDQGSVQVSVTRVGERIRLVVKDTGPGIALEHQERIFEAFQQGDVGIQRRFGGTGLGLAITQRIVRLMGGEVTLRSAPGEGSEFALDVPLPSVTHTAPAPSMRSLPEPRSLRVLLAEDDPVNASMTAALLSKLGHQVKVVSNGRECVEEMGGGDHELILMDVHMPEIDGLQATQLIRQREKEGDGKQHVPIVALTADAMKGDDLRCLSAGMDAYLAKPVTVAALKDLLMWFGSQP
jgi:signal transduction histidine kinase/CheY-like chemotaxis protein